MYMCIHVHIYICVYICILVQYTNTYLTVTHTYIHLITCGNLQIFVHIHVYIPVPRRWRWRRGKARAGRHAQTERLDAAGEKKERQIVTKRQGEEAVQMEFEDDDTEACVKRCTHCPRIFARPQAYSQHVAECKEKQEQKDSQKTTAVLRSAVEIVWDVVHSAASLSIGPDFAYTG